MTTDTWNRHSGMILTSYNGINDPSGWEIGQIWAKIAKKLAEIPKAHLGKSNGSYPSLMAMIGYRYLKETWWHDFKHGLGYYLCPLGQELIKFEPKLPKNWPKSQNPTLGNSNDSYPSPMAMNGYR